MKFIYKVLSIASRVLRRRTLPYGHGIPQLTLNRVRAEDDKAFAQMKTSNIWEISHDDFVKLITPSFSAVDEVEDMDAIMARTHFIVITDNGIYYRVAATTKTSINFIPWGNEPKDLLAQSQVEIFKAYKLNPHGHKLPPSYHEDCAWSQEVLRRLLSMVKMFRRVTPSTVLEACSAMRCTFLAQTVLQMSLSKICFILYIPLLKQDHKLSRFLCFMFNIKTPVNVRPAQEVRPSLLSEEALRVRVKKEKVTHAFRALKEAGPQAIDLDTPSPSPKKRAHDEADDANVSRSSKNARGDAPSSSTIPNPEFAGHLC